MKDLEETFTDEGKDNLLLGMQMENTSKSQRKSLLKWCRGVSCQWVHTHQRFNRKWLLIFRFRKKKRKLEMTEENYGSYGRLEKYRETARDVLRNMARELQSHVLKDAAENMGNNRNVEMMIHTSPSFGRRLLLLNITKKKKESTRLDLQEKKRTWPGKLEGQRVHSNKGGVSIGSLRETKSGNEMKRSKLELEQLKLMQEHNKALKKLKKWMKHKFKQKNKKGSIKLDGAVMKIKKLLAATMTERAELRFECTVQGKLLSLFKIGWTKILWNWKKHKIIYMRQNIKGIMTATFGDRKVSLRDARMGYKVTKFKHELETEQLLQGRKNGLKKLATWMRRKLTLSHSFECNHPINLLKAWSEQSKKRPSGNYIAVMWNLKREPDLSRKQRRYKQRYNKSQWLHMVEKMITKIYVEKPVYLRLQRNGGSEHVISCQWDPGGAGSGQEDKIKRVGTADGTLLGHYQETRLIRSTIQAIKATDRGTKGRVIEILLFEILMKVSSEIQKGGGNDFRVMEMDKVIEAVMSSDSWMRGRLIPIMNSIDTIKETSRDEFRMGTFEKHKSRIFPCNWLHSPRPPELLLCSVYQFAIQDCRNVTLLITVVEED